MHRPFIHSGSRSVARPQRGAATLIVVMLLFFIISMVAAYTSRNLIFEQRTSANQYRSTQAFEAADAGLEWTLAQLNAGRMGASCAPSTTSGDTSFAQRYLSVDIATGGITPSAEISGLDATLQPRCVFDSNTDPSNPAWKCTCPSGAATSLSAPAGAGPAPAFLVRMTDTARPDLIQLEVSSCTRLNMNCLSFATAFDNRGGTGDGVALTAMVLALRGAITRPPAAALTVAGSLAALPAANALSLTNVVAAAGGITFHTAGTEPGGQAINKRTLAGAPPSGSVIVGDASLAPATIGALPSEDRRFALFFGVLPDTYFNQPGMVEVNCSAGCDAAAVNLALLRNPGRAIRVKGAGTLTIDANIGTVSAPALLIVDEGDVDFAANVTLTGLLYGRKPAWVWTVAGVANIEGAAIAEGGLTLAGGSGATSIVYNKPVLTTLRVGYGTFVRVPGSWRDFQ